MKLLFVFYFLFALPATASDLCETAKNHLRSGDLIFIGIDRVPFRQVAETTDSWTSHVGIAFNENNSWRVYESTIPHSGSSDLCKFLKRAKDGRFAITRYKGGLNDSQIEMMKEKAKSLFGILYHSGFDYDDWRQFCSKFTHQVYLSAGISLGQIVSFRELFNALSFGRRRDELVSFWKRWFFAGFRWSGIPWERRTITPASQLRDPQFEVVFGEVE